MARRAPARGNAHWRDYWALTKPRVVALIAFTALVGMFLAVPGLPPLRQTVFGLLGIWLAAASAAAINHLIDQRIDKLMARTADRPLATGALQPAQVLAFAVLLGAASMTILIALVNPLTASLTFASLIGYAIVYTAWLKRATPQNIVIGGIAGAAPPLLGWSAVTGMQGAWDWAHALLLVLIVFVWTPPHFWALAIFRREDYARALVPMLPVTHGVRYTRWQILLYTLLLVAVSVLPFAGRLFDGLYFAAAIGLGAVFVALALLLWRRGDGASGKRLALRVYLYSLAYLALLFGAMVLDARL